MIPRIEHLFIAAGHAYFGRHGQPAAHHPVVARERVECVAGRGLRGDRFFDHRENYQGQVTFFAMEVLDALRRELGLVDTDPALTRRNVFTRGLHLPDLIGTEFELQGVRFVGTEESRPCYWMNEAFGDPRAEAWLAGRGGLRARILSDGWLHRDPRTPGSEDSLAAPPP